MEPEGSFPCSQKPVTEPSPEADEPSPHLHFPFLKNHFNIIPSFMPTFPKSSFLYRFNNENICISHLPTRATCSTNLVLNWSSL